MDVWFPPLPGVEGMDDGDECFANWLFAALRFEPMSIFEVCLAVLLPFVVG